MNKEKLFNEVVNYLVGSCMGIEQAFADVCQYSKPPIEVPNQEVIDEFEQYLENIEMFCCEECGWWGYPGEGECDCDCYED